MLTVFIAIPNQTNDFALAVRPQVDKVVAHGHHCACPCCPCLKTWETAVGWPGRLHGGWAGASREDRLIAQNHFGTQTKAFSFAPPFKNHWDAYAGETMGGQSCCPRAPLCMAVSPMSKNLGKHCWLARTGPWRSSGRCRGQGQVAEVGVVCWKGKNHWVPLSN